MMPGELGSGTGSNRFSTIRQCCYQFEVKLAQVNGMRVCSYLDLELAILCSNRRELN